MRSRILTAPLSVFVVVALGAGCGGRPAPQIDRIDVTCDSVLVARTAYTYDDADLITAIEHTEFDDLGGDLVLRAEILNNEDGSPAAVEYTRQIGSSTAEGYMDAVVDYSEDRPDMIRWNDPDGYSYLEVDYYYNDDGVPEKRVMIQFDAGLQSTYTEDCAITHRDDGGLEGMDCTVTIDAPASSDSFDIFVTYSNDQPTEIIIDDELTTLEWGGNDYLDRVVADGSSSTMSYDEESGFINTVTIIDGDGTCAYDITYQDGEVAYLPVDLPMSSSFVWSMLGVDGKGYANEPLTLHLLAP